MYPKGSKSFLSFISEAVQPRHRIVAIYGPKGIDHADRVNVLFEASYRQRIRQQRANQENTWEN